MQAVRAYVSAGGEPSRVENEQLAAHLARLTVDQLHAVKAEHGLKASAGKKEALVAKLAERFRAHRATQEPAGAKALKEAVAGKPGFHNVREVVGGHAVSHGPTGSQVRADHAGTRFDVLTSGSTLHSSHATAAAAVKAAETSNRFGTGQSTAEEESRARHEAIAKSRERAAAEKPFAAILNHPKAQNLSPEQQERLRSELVAWKQRLGDHYAGVAVRTYGGGTQVEILKTKYGYHGKETVRAATFPLPDQPAKPPAAAPPAPAGGGTGKVSAPPLSFPANDKRPTAENRRQAAEAINQLGAQARALYDGHKQGPGGYAVQSSGLHPADIETHHRARVLGVRGTGQADHPTPTNASLHKAVQDAERELNNRLRAVAEVAARRGHRPAGFSVHGALSPEEAEERAALRRVESYAGRENARLRAVREGVGT